MIYNIPKLYNALTHICRAQSGYQRNELSPTNAASNVTQLTMPTEYIPSYWVTLNYRASALLPNLNLRTMYVPTKSGSASGSASGSTYPTGSRPQLGVGLAGQAGKILVTGHETTAQAQQNPS
ncbi:uncharacterized protein N7529_003782 [Penicillium soppii]|uniref:uncharacterized protein n=1 Tax=Penicillium soppii TaxID=69789 RepID=UPI002547522C|nr:uncharacterized protein N7529_003782 [Penicillium soppii]KAJ5871429.1 hypothetical protein N7529_003782 [Penicillium soppii]